MPRIWYDHQMVTSAPANSAPSDGAVRPHSVADEIYAAVDGKSDRITQKRYLAAYDFIHNLTAKLKADPSYRGDDGDEDIVLENIVNALEYDTENVPVGFPPLLQNFSTEELMVIFEATQCLNFAQLSKNSGESERPTATIPASIVMNHVLNHPRTSLETKLAIACLDVSSHSCFWVCTEAGGIYIHQVIDKLLHQMGDGDDGDEDDYARNQISYFIYETLHNRTHGPDRDERRRAIITGLKDEVVTKNFLQALLGRNSDLQIGDLSMAPFKDILAKHARRLYDMPEGVPDEWVLKAVA